MLSEPSCTIFSWFVFEGMLRELPEILSAIYPSGLEGCHENPDPIPESMSNKRIFRPMSSRSSPRQDTPLSSSVFYANPSLLLPSISDNMTEEDFITILDSLLVRLENASNNTPGNLDSRSSSLNTLLDSMDSIFGNERGLKVSGTTILMTRLTRSLTLSLLFELNS